jgi:CDP-diacylglycerol--serine O-phosphatidyltransferase
MTQSAMKKHIPNLLTICNLVSGIAGIWFVLEHNPYYAALMVLLAAVFDFLDGFLARLLKSTSAIGKSLDSLADMISFGVLPGFLVFRLQTISIGLGLGYEWIPDLKIHECILLLSPVIIPVFSAIRLARFDHDERQKMKFYGLPTPANALFIASWIYSYPMIRESLPGLFHPLSIFLLSTLFSVLLLVNLPMISLKFKNYYFRENLAKYLVILIFTASILVWGIPGIMTGILFYILISIIAAVRPSSA